MDIQVTPTKLEGVVVIETDYFRDHRGFFIESYHRERFYEHGLEIDFVQDNHSASGPNVIRGIHYQNLDAPMAKLVRCTVGRVLDIAVDLRVGSPTYGEWVGVELSAEKQNQIFVPVGFGHGFAALSERSELQYKCGGYYDLSSEGTVLWNDQGVGIEWPIDDPVLSDKDEKGLTLAEYGQDPAFIYEQMT